VRLSPVSTSATTWPIVPVPDDNDECGAVDGMGIGKGNRSTQKKQDPMSICPSQIPHGMTRVGTRAAEV
jgi:hypothetical protein